MNRKYLIRISLYKYLTSQQPEMIQIKKEENK